MRAPTLALAALCGCTATPVTQTVWQGYIYADPYVDDALLEGGLVEVLDADGDCVPDGDACLTATDDDTAGLYGVVVDKGLDLALRVSGPGVAPTVWRAQAPTANSAQWFSGALYTRRVDALDAFAASLGLSPAPTSLSDASTVWMWGSPNAPADWAGATVVAEDADGSVAEVLTFAVTDDGALVESAGGPVDLFVAFDLAPGVAILEVTAEDGRTARQTWPTLPGDLVSAAFFALPTE